MQPLVERGPTDSKVCHALLRGHRLAVMGLEQESVRAGELVEGGVEASRKSLPNLPSSGWGTVGLSGDVGPDARRLSLFSPISPDPVDGGMVDACREKGAEALGVADTWRALEPAPKNIDDDILSRAFIGDVPSSKGQHLRAVSLVQESHRLRLSVAQGAQEIFVAFRHQG